MSVTSCTATGPTYCDGSDSWQPGSGTCAACGQPLTGRSSWFCPGGACARYWRRNHQWAEARREALRRQRSCAKCGAGPGRPKGCRLEVNHIRAIADTALLRGRRNGRALTGCWNHQENLEVLCVPCHHTCTAEQARARREGVTA